MQQIIRQIKNQRKGRKAMCMYEEKTEKVMQGYLIFQGILAHKKEERRGRKGGEEEC